MFLSGLASFLAVGSLSVAASAFPTQQNFFGVARHAAPVDIAWDAFNKLNDTANDIYPQLIDIGTNPQATPKDALKLFNAFNHALKQTGDAVSVLNKDHRGSHMMMSEHSLDDIYLLCQIIFDNTAEVYSQLLLGVADSSSIRSVNTFGHGPGIGSPVAEYTTTYTKFLMNSGKSRAKEKLKGRISTPLDIYKAPFHLIDAAIPIETMQAKVADDQREYANTSERQGILKKDSVKSPRKRVSFSNKLDDGTFPMPSDLRKMYEKQSIISKLLPRKKRSRRKYKPPKDAGYGWVRES